MNGVKDLAQKRSQFAYGCATQGKSILNSFQINDEYYKDDKYKSYVKKIPMMILTNGLGATFAFIYSKQKSYDSKKNKKAGEKENPKNGYDLIYKQVDEWLKKDYKQNNDDELIQWIIDQDSQSYRAVTNEVLALFNWLKRFADGMIEGDDNVQEEG
jgi:CRISPR-associated protein Cmr5